MSIISSLHISKVLLNNYFIDIKVLLCFILQDQNP